MERMEAQGRMMGAGSEKVGMSGARADAAYMREGMDLRRFLLLSFRRGWVVLVAALLGAALIAGIYSLVYHMANGTPSYRVRSLYYLYFDTTLAQETQLYYNDYTWNAVIDSDEVAGVAAAHSGIERALIESATFVPTMSDIRMIELWVECPDPAQATAIRDAMEEALAEFALRTEGFREIASWERGEALQVQKPNLALRYGILGAVVGTLAGLLLLLYRYAMDDGIYVEEDAERHTGLPVAEVVAGDGKTLRQYADGASLDAMDVLDVDYGTSSRQLKGMLRERQLKGEHTAALRLTGVDARFYRMYYLGADRGESV